MRNDKKIKAVRRKYGHAGYSVYNMLLEIIGDEDLLIYSVENDLDWELLAGDIDIETETLKEMISYFDQIDLIQYDVDNLCIKCEQLEKRMECVFIKRGKTLDFLRQESSSGCVSAPEKTVEDNFCSRNPQKSTEPVETAPETPQSKVKKSKVNTIYLPFAQKLKEYVVNTGTDMVLKDSHVEKWSNDFRLMVEIDKRGKEEIYKMMESVFNDDFWSKNIRSASKLRKQWNEGKLDRLNNVKKKTTNDTESKKNRLIRKQMELEKVINESYLSKDECFRKWNEDCGTNHNINNLGDYHDSFIRFIKQYYTER